MGIENDAKRRFLQSLQKQIYQRVGWTGDVSRIGSTGDISIVDLLFSDCFFKIFQFCASLPPYFIGYKMSKVDEPFGSLFVLELESFLDNCYSIISSNLLQHLLMLRLIYKLQHSFIYLVHLFYLHFCYMKHYLVLSLFFYKLNDSFFLYI